MNKTVVGVFLDRAEAEHAIEELQSMNFDAKDISVVMRDREAGESISKNTGASVAEGAASGAATGGVVGGLAGLLVGIGAIAVPGIGALLIGGPLAVALGLTGAAATTVSGAVTGVLAGGLVGGLVGLGMPEEDARNYEERIRGGGILVAVPATSDEEGDVKVVFEEHGADQIRTLTQRSTQYQEDRDYAPAYLNEVPKRRLRG